ncbi:hypothetical protein Nepgr_015492 [Nepenthes gracilis]|uniref:Uncharacterized protein n=1 Tax=Nepenthes gracilis TaxID=150966 RepID=A0AAD3XRC1_NEPGR|nr:hypothetical protein Nepgr_015492 [Nepenthes gracilis]
MSRGSVHKWEKQPEFSKLIINADNPEHRHSRQQQLERRDLPPPPCCRLQKAKVHDLQIPLPPCIFQPSLTRYSGISWCFWKKEKDPFLAAYKECTKSNTTRDKLNGDIISDQLRVVVKKIMSSLSCKLSRSLKDVAMVGMPKLTGKRKVHRKIRITN